MKDKTSVPKRKTEVTLGERSETDKFTVGEENERTCGNRVFLKGFVKSGVDRVENCYKV